MEQLWTDLCWPKLIGASGKPYKPNPTQQPAVTAFNEGCRFLLIFGGERSGKSQTASAIAIKDMGPREDKSPRRYWIVGPNYREARPEFEYIYRCLSSLGFIERVSMPQDETSPWSFTTKYGVTVETRTGYDTSMLASFSIHGAIICEAAKQQFDVWTKMRGRVSETRGWVILVGTPEESLPWYNEMYERWRGENADGGQSFSLPTHTNIDVFPGGENDPEILSLRGSFGMTDEKFNERYSGIVTKSNRLVIPEFDWETHVRDLEVHDAPIELAIDPGKSTYAVAFIQPIGLTLAYVHDCVYMRGNIAQQVIPQVMTHPLWNKINFGAKIQGCIDVAGKHESATESQLALWKELAGIDLEYKYQFVGNTLQAVRYRLQQNFLLFSSKMKTGSTPDGIAIEAMSEFSLWKWKEQRPDGNERNLPPDVNNHFIKALGYYCLWKYGRLDTDSRRAKTKHKAPVRLGSYEAIRRYMR
jgi:hypothetical protein